MTLQQEWERDKIRFVAPSPAPTTSVDTEFNRRRGELGLLRLSLPLWLAGCFRQARPLTSSTPSSTMQRR
jgi:hypothetical protein